ncbi:MAG: hypothetical protein Q8P67_07510 [archaeon]|nr:hypothetical protein [archaeon]
MDPIACLISNSNPSDFSCLILSTSSDGLTSFISLKEKQQRINQEARRLGNKKGGLDLIGDLIDNLSKELFCDRALNLKKQDAWFIRTVGITRETS